MKRRDFVGGLTGVAAAAMGMPARAGADAFSGDGPFKIGQSAPFTGPSAALGLDTKQGMDACFHSINRAGGVHGRQIESLALDDGYEPDRTLANVQRLHAAGVFALCGNVGTPTSLKALPYVASMGLPFIGAVTGAADLRTQTAMNRVVFNVRAGYDDEAPAIVKQLTSFNDNARIALFVQADTYGTSVRTAVEKALNDRGLPAPVAIATVPRNASGAQLEAAIAAAATLIAGAHVDGVAMGSVYGACAKLVEALRAKNSYPLVASVSFVGTSYLLDYPGKAVVGMGIAQVMPAPMYPTRRVTQDYTKAMKELGQTKLTYSSIEGYVAARAVVAGLHRAGPNPTRERFLAALQSPLDLGDFVLNFSPTNRNGSKFVEMSVIAETADGRGKRITL